MTTIHDLPKELLPEIFKHLEYYEQIKIQHVCRAWYVPAHVLLLKNISLSDEYNINLFIASIDQNTSSTYLAAVEKIVLHSDDDFGVDYPLNKESIGKLICRFPNLKTVTFESFDACLEGFDEELCQLVLYSCPKLERFEIHLDCFSGEEDEEPYCRTMYRLRSLVTYLSLRHIGSASWFGGIINFITKFPRLHQLKDTFHNQSFQLRDYLVLLEKLSGLTSINIDRDYNGVEENFAEEYFVRKTKEEKDLVIGRLSKLNSLHYRSAHPYCPNIIKFIAKYLTGLKHLTIDSNFRDRSWTPIHQQLLSNELSSVLTEAQGSIALRYLQAETTAEFLPGTIHKLHSQLLSNNRTLQLVVQINPEMQDTIHVCIPWPATLNTPISIALSSQPSAYETINTLFKSKFTNIDHFVFYIRGRSWHSINVDIDTYNIVLKSITSLKKVTFNIPNTYKDAASSQEFRQYTRMETLTLRLADNVTIQSMLDTYALMFPNLKCLNLYYYSFVWSHPYHELCIDLTNYTLELLVLDMTPLKRMMKKQSIEGDYFVIYVSGKNERYKVSFDFTSITSISEEDSQNYIRVQIVISRLDSLIGYIFISYDETWDEYLHRVDKSYLKRAIIFE